LTHGPHPVPGASFVVRSMNSISTATIIRRTRPRVTTIAALIGAAVSSTLSCTRDSTGVDDAPSTFLDVVLGESAPYLGDAVPFLALGTDGASNVVTDGAIRWTSSHPEIASVDPVTGVATLHAYGSFTLTAESDDAYGAAVVVARENAARETIVNVVQQHEGITGLVLGYGPIVAEGAAYSCSYSGRWATFPRGSTVTVRVSTDVAPAIRDAIRNELAVLSTVTLGSLSARFALTQESSPLPGDNEVTVAVHEQPTALGCLTNAGCTIHRFAKLGVLAGSRVIMPSTQTHNAYVHDVVGHGLLGMCHVAAASIGGAANSLMSGGRGVYSNQTAERLSGLDRELQRAVWAASLEPGAGVIQFRDAGLIRP